jgi:hypothetical protein
MASFRFADILLTLVVLLITFGILYLVERGRNKGHKKKKEAGFAQEKKHSDN